MLWSEIPFGMRREAEVQILEKSRRKQKSSCKRRKVLHLCEKRGSTGRQQRRRKEEWKNKVRRSSFRVTTAGTQHTNRKSCFTTDDEVRGAPGCGCHRSSLYSHTEVSYVYETDVRNEREVLKRVKSNT